MKTLEAQLNQTGSTPDPHMIRYQHVLGQRYILSLINRLEEHKVDVPDAPFGLRLDKSLALDDSHDREVTPHLAESHANPMQHSIPGGHVEQHHYTSPGGHMEQDHHTIQQGHLEASAAQAQAINEQTGHGDLNHICAQGSSGESELERRINGELCKDRSWDEGPDLTMRRNG